MDLSIIIPARNEEFLQNTIDNILKNIRGDTDIYAILDGYWPDKSIPQHDRVNIVHHDLPIGQRAATNEGVKLCNSKFIMKCDAHCAFDEGFDVKLMADCEYDWTIIPTMYNLHAFDWKCMQCGKRTYQGPKPTECPDCDNTTDFRKKIVWKPKTNPRSEFYYFDTDLKFAYWRAFKKRPEAQGNLAPTMSNIGACYFMHRQRWLDIDGLDEGHGFWGQMGTEISCKTWLSGGQQFTNKKTWFAHMFRTGHGFGFPYKLSGKDVKKARKYSQDMWRNNKWPKAVHDLNWLIEKFKPIPGWHDEKKVETHNKSDRHIKITVRKSEENLNVPSDGKEFTKGFVYYTDNMPSERILKTVRNQLITASNGKPIVSVSQMPIEFGKNIVLNEKRSVLTMFKQILTGLENMDTDVVFLTEHDILYHPSHFEFTPLKPDIFYYNLNSWFVDSETGQALFYEAKQTSGVCAYRKTMIDHYMNRIQRVEKEGFQRRMGFEPGTHKYPRGFDYYTSDTYMSEHPNVDIRHTTNLTGKRFKKEQYRNQRALKGWKLTDEIPFWGKTKGRFSDFLFDINSHHK